MDDITRWPIAAWVIAAEGCITLTIHKYSQGPAYYESWISVGQKTENKQFVIEFKKIVGVGKIYKCGKNTIWSINKFEYIKYVLENILPYLPIKRQQAESLLEYVNSRISRPRHKAPYTQREREIAEEIRELNKPSES